LALWAANTGFATLTAAIAAPKIRFAIFAMIFFSAFDAEDWITSPQIPSRFLEHALVIVAVLLFNQSTCHHLFALRGESLAHRRYDPI
jgi:hypothetical protein